MTIPKRMFNQLVLQINPTITAIATLLIGFSIVAVALAAWMTRGSNGLSAAKATQ